MNKILFLITCILSLFLLAIDSSSNTTIFYSEPIIRVNNTKSGQVENMDLEDYIVGVVASEMPASFNEQALMAQAIAARTYATYKMQNSNQNYDVITSVTNQGYIDIEEMKNKWQDSFNKYYNKIKEAVYNTKGMIMYYEDEVVEAYYFAMSNGYTENSELVFSESKDYLQSVKSEYDESVKNFTVNKSFSKEEFCKLLNISRNKITISNIERSSTNRVNYITINDKKFKGTEIRKLLGLRSTDFVIDVLDNKVNITTKGYGHGVGMSQYGANGMANAGYNYEEILKYYYKNIKISSI